ncbi:hypothetical protein [Streptomyces sp. NPDC001401]|uniref:hypothetical protein n=1 Tax=Streptomyces sp. NPDC001401 TaxID=3364570 RepID=UPI0036C67142
MNRVGPGLAAGAGYVLGGTKKMKPAFADPLADRLHGRTDRARLTSVAGRAPDLGSEEDGEPEEEESGEHEYEYAHGGSRR